MVWGSLLARLVDSDDLDGLVLILIFLVGAVIATILGVRDHNRRNG